MIKCTLSNQSPAECKWQEYVESDGTNRCEELFYHKCPYRLTNEQVKPIVRQDMFDDYMGCEDVLTMNKVREDLREADLIRQAKDIVFRRGVCPKGTICADCIVAERGQLKECSMSYAEAIAKAYLIEKGETI